MGLVAARLASRLDEQNGTDDNADDHTLCFTHSNRPAFSAASLQNSSQIHHFSPAPLLVPESISTYLDFCSTFFLKNRLSLLTHIHSLSSQQSERLL